MVGSKLTDSLLAQGHQIAVLTRQSSYRHPQASVIVWDPALDYIAVEHLDGFDVVIHLAGATIAHYWTAEYKKSILESRVQSTKFLCTELSRLSNKPKLLISASAIGYYGSHPPEDAVDEKRPAGQGFLADTCRQWEEATSPASQAGIRVVRMRLGMVLSRTGGALAKMKQPFQLGIGGVLGDGRQMISWVSLDEIPYVVDHFIKNEKISGAVNVVSPNPVSNARFTECLGQVMHRPTVLPVPGFAVRFLFGEMGQSLLLEGAKVLPRCLQESGYQFHFTEINDALKAAFA